MLLDVSEHLLSIGNFALVSGLPITALRHYDDVGVLRPAAVDPATGYRRYRPDQAAAARLLASLRRQEVPIETMRAALTDLAVVSAYRDQLLDRARHLSALLEDSDNHQGKGIVMKGSRLTQVTIVAPDLPASIAFYQAAFDAEWLEDIHSLQFGSYDDGNFFLLTVADPQIHPWPGGPAKFGLLVPDVDAAHAKALAAGAVLVCEPEDKPWKPRASCVADPGGNNIDLYQA